MTQQEDDNSFWRWGVFYFNPKDKRIFPPKRLPALGWTINFGNPLSIIAFMVLIVLLLLLMEVFIKPM
jgi:uncharacterized membrane protein